MLDRAGDGWKISDIRDGSTFKKFLQGIARILEALKGFFVSMLRPLRNLVLGSGQQFLPATRTGPGGAWKLLSDQWKSDSSGILRMVRLVICCAIFFLPTIYMDLFVPKKAEAADIDGRKVPGRSEPGVAVARESYYVAVFAFLLFALFSGLHTSLFAVGLIIYLLADVLIHLFGQVFVWGKLSINSARSLFFALINYFELTIGFAVLYRHWDGVPLGADDPLSWLYFSVMTSAGGGNVDPTTTAGKVLVMVQISTAFLFAALIISALLGRTDRPDQC